MSKNHEVFELIRVEQGRLSLRLRGRSHLRRPQTHQFWEIAVRKIGRALYPLQEISNLFLGMPRKAADAKLRVRVRSSVQPARPAVDTRA